MNRLKKIGRVIGKWVGYPLFFLFCFVLFAYWTFPYERVADRLILEVEYPRGPGGVRQPSGYELEIVSLEPSWFTGVEANSVTLRKVAEDETQLPAEVRFETIEVHVGLFALMFGDVSADFALEFAGGTMEGNVSSSEDLQSIEAEIEGIHLRRVGLLRGILGVPVRGTLSGTIDLEIPADPAASEGSFDLRLAGAVVADDDTKIELEGFGELSLARMDVGDVQLTGAMQDGTLQIATLQGRGPDLDMDGEGSLRVRDPFAASQLDVLVNASFKDAFKDRNDVTRRLFAAMDMLPRAQAAKTPDGSLQWRITGTPRGGVRARPAGREPRPGE